jgi:hypothetical protein
MGNLLRDVSYGVKSLLRDKGFAGTVLLTLAIGIAGYTATFAIVHSVLLRPLPGPNADAIVLMSNEYPKAGAGDQSGSRLLRSSSRRDGFAGTSPVWGECNDAGYQRLTGEN